MYFKSFVVFFVISYVHCRSTESPAVGIIGGHNVSIQEVPYIASLRLNGTVHWCGSSIIHEQFVLTAAHCIVPNRNYSVLVGTDKVDKGGKLYDVEKILIHEMYSNKTNDYDICILKLNETVTFGPTVNKISIGDSKVKLKKGKLLSTTGWGYTQPKNATISENLRQVQVPVVPKFSCQISYLKKLKITPRMLCAGGHGKDSCLGDSGGPLTWNDQQVGVTSFGLGCGVYPGVYTKLSIMIPWINQTITQNL
ncbi:trypsin 5G1-like [Anticarsia gemmatalis]|uniref:trypsin 5G1-like n=1 Tax=Anticarsia gemmatalis TaxID=129554 RepID=UPI003F75E875